MTIFREPIPKSIATSPCPIFFLTETRLFWKWTYTLGNTKKKNHFHTRNPEAKQSVLTAHLSSFVFVCVEICITNKKVSLSRSYWGRINSCQMHWIYKYNLTETWCEMHNMSTKIQKVSSRCVRATRYVDSLFGSQKIRNFCRVRNPIGGYANTTI